MPKLSIAAAAVAFVLAAPPAAAQSPACLLTQQPGSVRLTVIATDIRAARGEVAVTLYPDSARRFLAKKGKLARARVPTRAPETSTCFWVTPGYYAIATYHDENGDHDFN